METAPIDLARDAMSPHLALWTRVDVTDPPPEVRPWLARAVAAGSAVDLHRRFVARFDGPQHADGARAARYLAALDLVRAAADRGEALTVDALARVQGVVLGLPDDAPLRRTDAFARGGAHRYPMVPGFDALVRARFDAWEGATVDPVVTACGRYLDVIFLHPFEDGNARAARLALEWALRRAGRPTPRLEDLVALRKEPGDARSFWRMVRVCAGLVARAATEAA
ncbi:MAG: Fic family protein [Polyangiales bacterium]